MSNQLSSIEPTTHLYRRYVHEVLERLHSNVHETDWLLLSSQILSELLADCGHDAAWAKPVAWETYASPRYDALREQLRSLLDAARRHSSRPPPDTEGWFAQGDKIWVRVGTNTFGHPDLAQTARTCIYGHLEEHHANYPAVSRLQVDDNVPGREHALGRPRHARSALAL